MFIAAEFIIAKTWKQSKCSLTEEWINKILYINTMEHYSAIKRNELLRYVTKSIILQINTLAKRKHTHYDSTQIKFQKLVAESRCL